MDGPLEQYHRYNNYLRIFDPLNSSRAWGENTHKKKFKKWCARCENAEYFSGPVVFSMYGVEFMIDVMFRPHIIIINKDHDVHNETTSGQWDVYKFLKMLAACVQFCTVFDVHNFALDIRSGTWKTHHGITYWRLLIDAEQFIRLFETKLTDGKIKLSKKEWFSKYEKQKTLASNKEKTWIADEKKKLFGVINCNNNERRIPKNMCGKMCEKTGQVSRNCEGISRHVQRTSRPENGS